MEENSFISGCRGGWKFTISGIFSASTFAKIIPSIIQAIAVAVVALLAIITSQYQSMHSYFWSAIVNLIGSQCIEFTGLRVLICPPIPLREPVKITSINDGILALRERDQSVGCIKRLDNRVSFNAAFHRCTPSALLKFSRYCITFALFSSAAYGQVTLMPYTKSQWLDNNGRPVSAGCLFSYLAGSSTPAATYTSSNGSVPNTNPVLLDSAGRADVWLSPIAYKLVLYTQGGTNCSTGVQLWSEDNISSSFTSLLALANTWTGANVWNNNSTFNGAATFTVGLTANGPANLTLGGSLAGTFSGSPTFSGTPNFSGGVGLASLSLSGQLTSTLAIGTPPFVITSTTLVPNLNVAQLEGDTWEAPGTIGSTTPSTGAFSALTATSLALNGGTVQTGTQGTDTKLLTAGTVSGSAGTAICLDANAGATTASCPALHLISLGTNSSVCSTTNSAGATCSTVVNISPNQSDTLYIANCSGISPTQFPFIIGLSKSLTSITVTISNGTASQAQISTFAELDCSAIHN
jgi:hypothetical protein